MRTVLQKAVCLSIFSAAALLGLDANATLLLSGDVGGANPFCVTDQASCTQSGTTLDDVDAGLGGFVVPTFGVANVVVNGLQATATIAGTTNTLAFLIGSVVNQNTTPVTISITVSSIGFSAPVSLTTRSGSGTWTNANGSSATLTWYIDPANTQGAGTVNGRPGTLLQTFTDAAVGASDSFSHSSSGAVAVTTPFSMTLGLDLTLAAGGTLSNFGQSEIAALVNGTQIPEPVSFALIALGLLGLAYTRTKHR